MSLKTGVFSSMTLAALLALVSTTGVAAEQKAAEAEKKAAEAEKSDAELQRKLAAARKRLDAAAREVAELSMSLSDSVVPHMERYAMLGSNRGMLGVGLGSRRGSEPAEGVEIVSVSPGGAAEEGGLKAGDVLLEVNGKALKREGDKSARQKLMETMREVKPGDKVPVSYRRDGKVAKVTLTTQALKDRVFTMAAPHIQAMPHVGQFRFGSFGHAEALFGSAEIVPLTPKLGQYFGAEAGLLVVRAPEDNRLKLEDGDVIVDIDGRKPSSPSHAMRILTSYQEGEKLKLNILRARKPLSLEVTVPETPGGGFERSLEKRLKDVDGKFERRVIYSPMHAAPGFPVAPPEAGLIAIPAVPAPHPAPMAVPAPPLPDEPV
ncbi:MAG: PDZ domain-containing protein [Steroidobacteraceae bacterium]